MVDERPGERDALLLAAGHLPRPASLVAGQADQRQRLADAPVLLGLADLGLAQAVADVAGDVHVREEGVVLEDRVDVALVGRDAGDRLAGEQDLALGRLLEAGDHPQRRRLAAARRPEQAVERAAGDAQRHPVHGRHVAEALRDLEDLDIGIGVRRGAGARARRARARREGRGARVRRQGGGQRRSSGADDRALSTPCSIATGGTDGTGEGRRRQRAFRANLARNRGIVGDAERNRLYLYFRRRMARLTREGTMDDGPAARIADPRAPPGAPAHPARGRRQGRGHRELPLAGRARRDQPVHRDRPADRPRPRPLDRPALRRGGAERARRPARGPAPGRLPGPPGGRRVPDLEHGRAASR